MRVQEDKRSSMGEQDRIKRKFEEQERIIVTVNSSFFPLLYKKKAVRKSARARICDQKPSRRAENGKSRETQNRIKPATPGLSAPIKLIN